MPVYGKKVSPQELIGQKFHKIEHVVVKGEHQVWFENDKFKYIFFEPVFCCDAITVDYLDPAHMLTNKTVKSIQYEKGKYTFTFSDDTTWVMQWIGVKKLYKIDMVKLSEQTINW